MLFNQKKFGIQILTETSFAVISVLHETPWQSTSNWIALFFAILDRKQMKLFCWGANIQPEAIQVPSPTSSHHPDFIIA